MMPEESLEKVESAVQLSEIPENLAKINANLVKIHGQLKESNSGKLRENLRLAVTIVLFTVPLSLMVSLMSEFLSQRYLSNIGDGSSLSALFSFLLIIFIIIIVYITIKVANPLYQLHNDEEIKELLRALNQESKKSK